MVRTYPRDPRLPPPAAGTVPGRRRDLCPAVLPAGPAPADQPGPRHHRLRCRPHGLSGHAGTGHRRDPVVLRR
ncbi:hypothetical protein ACFFX0_22510 [Citricoccus parietis]|uniref:Uncharacterized protein n=1 Tax=Citricoccus parietis TaxID=592307 RepID=A0ABV5G4H2_9MICC